MPHILNPKPQPMNPQTLNIQSYTLNPTPLIPILRPLTLNRKAQTISFQPKPQNPKL